MNRIQFSSMFSWRTTWALCIVNLAVSLSVQAQSAHEIPLGTWRDHLPMTNGLSVAQSEQYVYCATPNGLIIYNQDDQSLEKLGRFNGLSDIGISCIEYHQPTQTLIIAYKNGNIDFLQGNRITNFSDIKRASSIQGSKSIHKLRVDGNLAYFCCNFGIVVVDLLKREVRSTILPSLTKPETFDLAISEDSLYAATAGGVYTAYKKDPSLIYYVAWKNQTLLGNNKFSHIAFFDGCLYAAEVNSTNGEEGLKKLENGTVSSLSVGYEITDTKVWGDRLIVTSNEGMRSFKKQSQGGGEEGVYSYGPGRLQIRVQSAIRDQKNPDIYWMADQNYGLMRTYLLYDFKEIIPAGPYSSGVFAMDTNGQSIWVAPGAYDGSYSPFYRVEGIYRYRQGIWDRYELKFPDFIRDIVALTVDPGNPEHVFGCSWGNGIAELRNGLVVNQYTESNSTLQGYIGIPNDLRISGSAMDGEGNLWAANAGVAKPVSVRNVQGEWKALGFSSDINNSQTGAMMIDSTGQKWVILQEKGVLLFKTDENNNVTAYKRLTDLPSHGNLSTAFVLSMATDRDGLVWIGTTKGVSVFYSPDFILETGAENWDSQRIIVSQGGYNQYLLDAEEVSAICVDGANRKWLGTRKAGVFLVSPDGTQQLAHFNTENSPILSNTIYALSINGESGELFIGTDQGICSFRTDATSGGNTFGNVYAFPNPVRPDYKGMITISGLVRDADVKITDVSGNLVYQTVANGGTATWNGNLYSGERAATGVYLVFCTNADGSQTKVSKILFVN